MSASPDEPIAYGLIALTNAESRFYNVPHHYIVLDNPTPTYDPATIAPEEAPLTTIQRL